jgi:hypothetical protein
VRELDLLRIDQDHAHVVRRRPQEDRSEHRVDRTRLARAGRARDQQVRHLGQVGADRAARDVLAEPHGDRRPVRRGLLEDVAEVHDPPPGVGDLDAHGLLARDRRQDPDVRRGERVGEVVLELGDLRDLDPGREAQLVARDVRPGDHPDHARLDPEVPERLDQLRRDALLAGRIGPRGLCGGALEEAPAGHRPHELRRVGDLAPVAALRSEIGFACQARRASGALAFGDVTCRGTRDPWLVGLGILGQARLGRLRIGGRRLLLFLGLLRRRGLVIEVGEALVARPEVALGHHRGVAVLPAGLQRRELLPRAPAGDLRRGAVPQQAAGARDRVARRLQDARDRRAGEQQDRCEEQEDRDDVGADVAQQRRGPPIEPLPHHPAARLDELGVPEADALAERAEPERPRRERQRERREQAQPAGAERPDRGQDRAQDEHGAGRHQRGRNEVVRRADEPAQALDEAGAAPAAVPAEVDQEREEHGQGHQAEADQVEMALLERRQRHGRPAHG